MYDETNYMNTNTRPLFTVNCFFLLDSREKLLRSTLSPSFEQERIALCRVSIRLTLDLACREDVPKSDANHRHQIEHAKCGLTEPAN
jgi:hypothetical protein